MLFFEKGNYLNSFKLILINSMRGLFLILAVLQSYFVYPQEKRLVVNFDTREAIPFASIYIKNQEKGTSSDLEGSFILTIDSHDTLMISSVGYKTLELPFQMIKDTIKMEEDIQQLGEIVIRPKREKSGWFSKKNVLGNVGNAYFTINVWYGSGGNPGQLARFFEYKNQYQYTPYIKRITFSTGSSVKEAVFSVKLYEADTNGLPGKLINSKIIKGTAKNRYHKASINLEDQFLKFPKRGLFVAIEFINIEKNRSLKNVDYGFLYDDYKYDYSPLIGLIGSEDFELYKYDYKKGRWYKSTKLRNKLECEIILVE
jgi:hypothetical protein